MSQTTCTKLYLDQQNCEYIDRPFESYLKFGWPPIYCKKLELEKSVSNCELLFAMLLICIIFNTSAKHKTGWTIFVSSRFA
jgi:hypothetical protein